MKGWTNNLVHKSSGVFVDADLAYTQTLQKIKNKIISIHIYSSGLWVSLIIGTNLASIYSGNLEHVRNTEPRSTSQTNCGQPFHQDSISVHTPHVYEMRTVSPTKQYTCNYLYLVLMTHSQIKYFPLKVKYIWMFMFFFLSRLSALIIINKAGVEIHLF